MTSLLKIPKKHYTSPLMGLLIGFLLVMLCQFILLPLVMVGLGYLWGFGPEESFLTIGGQFPAEADKYFFRSVQGFNQLLSWGFVGWLMAAYVGERKDILQWRPSKIWYLPFLGILVVWVSLPLSESLSFDADTFRLPAMFADQEQSIHANEARLLGILLEVLKSPQIGILLFNILIFAVLPAICEEVFFRGFVQSSLSKMVNPHVAIFLSAMIFSLIHFQFYGFFTRMFLGMILGYLVLWSGSLYPAIAGHFAFNLLSILMTYFAFNSDIIAEDTVNQKIDFSWPIILLSAFLLGLVMFFTKKESEKLHE